MSPDEPDIDARGEGEAESATWSDARAWAPFALDGFRLLWLMRLSWVLTRELRLLVLDKGFELDGVHYRLLSEAARAVTGSRWNGRLAEFDGYAVAGDQLRYDAKLETVDERAAVTRGTVYKNGSPLGRVDLMFSHVDQAEQSLDLPDHNFVFTGEFMNLLTAFKTRSHAESERGDGS